VTAPADAPPGPTPLRILVFEDRPEDAELSLHTLRTAGFTVAADVASTLGVLKQRLQTASYDVVLSDYNLPDATGMDALETMKSCGAEIPFVLVTGSLGDEKAVECLKQGVSDYVLKDRLVRLPSAVKRALGERQLRQERARAEEALRRSEDELRNRNRELEEQNRRVEAASRAKSEFMANMSHELRSPLNAIIGFSQLIFDGKVGPLTEFQKDAMDRIVQSGNHLLQLVNDVLDLSRVEAGKLELRPQRISVALLVAEACDSMAAVAAEKCLRIEPRIPAQLDAVVDPGRLKQIIYNYLSNALKFSEEGGSVTVEVKPEGSGEFRVEVTDTGMGISDADQERLFTNFHQLDCGKAKRFQGTGLGLSLTKRIVEAQGGKVGVRSEVGKGSTFFAVLPRHPGKENGDELPTDSDRRR
jgi:signal transduction histidine kinase